MRFNHSFIKNSTEIANSVDGSFGLVIFNDAGIAGR